MANINLGNISFDEKSFLEEASKNLRSQQTAAIKHILSNLFKDTKERQSPYGYKDKDSGFLYDLCLNNILSEVETEKWKEFAEKYIETQFENYLKAALIEAMQHHARKIAFARINEQAPRLPGMLKTTCKHCKAAIVPSHDGKLWLNGNPDTPQYCWVDFVKGSQLHEPEDNFLPK